MSKQNDKYYTDIIDDINNKIVQIYENIGQMNLRTIIVSYPGIHQMKQNIRSLNENLINYTLTMKSSEIHYYLESADLSEREIIFYLTNLTGQNMSQEEEY